MSSLTQATETQLRNIQAKTGKSLAELAALVRASGLIRHGEIRAMLQQTLGLGHGDANALVHAVLQSDGERAAEAKGASADDVLNEIYTGARAVLRPIHDALMAHITPLGEFEIVPKKGYVSLRRKKQFAMIGPGTNTRVDLGLNVKGLPAHARLKEEAAGSMCNYKVKLTAATEVDDDVARWIRAAFESAG